MYLFPVGIRAAGESFCVIREVISIPTGKRRGHVLRAYTYVYKGRFEMAEFNFYATSEYIFFSMEIGEFISQHEDCDSEIVSIIQTG